MMGKLHKDPFDGKEEEGIEEESRYNSWNAAAATLQTNHSIQKQKM